MASQVVGIVSYLPSDNSRDKRKTRLLNLLTQINTFWPGIPIMIIAQNWAQSDSFSDCNISIYRYDKPLGIVGARKVLREKFLESNYDQLIMFDDDAVIQTTQEGAKNFLKVCNNHPYGFMFLKGWKKDPLGVYSPAQLNGCVISKWLMQLEPYRDAWDPQKATGVFEDVTYSHLFHWKYPEYEFEIKGFQCIQWQNAQYSVQSTWRVVSGIGMRTRQALEKLKKECEEYRKNVSFEYLEELKKLKPVNKTNKRIVITYGTFDLFHYGHVNLLKRAKALGDYLIVGVSTDEMCHEKGKEPILNCEKRMALVQELKCVDLVIPEVNMTQKVEDVEKYQVDVFVLGSDYKETFPQMPEYELIKDKCEVIFLDRTANVSTTLLKEEVQAEINIKPRYKDPEFKYVIMCGGTYAAYTIPKALQEVHGEKLLHRTIRLLKENGINPDNIIITTSSQTNVFDEFGVKVVCDPNNVFTYDARTGKHVGYWVNAFWRNYEPTCYLFGDVFYSPETIQTIINTWTIGINFFSTVKPFSKNYIKNHVEPMAFKVRDYPRLYAACDECKLLYDKGKFWRHPIAFDVWCVLQGYPTHLDYFKPCTADVFGPDFIPITDYSCDVDSKKDVDNLNFQIEKGNIKP